MQKTQSANRCFICVHLWRDKSLKDDRFSFGHDEHFILDPVDAGGLTQTLERLFERLITEPKSSVMHRHERSRFEFVECANRFLRIHVHLAGEWRIVGADRQERDLNVVTFADLLESFEVGGVAAMKNRATIRPDDKTPEAAMRIRQKPRAPMMRGCQ